MKELDWEARYRTWGQRPRDLDGAYSDSRLLEAISALAPIGPDTRVLEVGCAPGRWLAWIQERLGARVYGVDLNLPGLVLSRFACPVCGLGRADAALLPFGDKSFDVVFSLGLVEHFEDPAPLLEEQWRVLRGGGRVMVSVPNIGPGTIQGWHWRRFKPGLYEAHVAYTAPDLIDRVVAAGFTSVTASHVGVYLPHLQRVAKRLLPPPVLRPLERPSWGANLVVTGSKPH